MNISPIQQDHNPPPWSHCGTAVLRVIVSLGHHAGLTTKPKLAQMALETRILERFAS
jgi:hypothetical protein